MNGQYRPGEVVLGNWTLIEMIGEGSYGRVFKAEREDFGRVYNAAIKIITIPQSQSEIKNVMADGMDKDSITAYFRGFVEELVGEFSLMSNLKGNSNVVSYEDHTVTQHTEGIGWDIIIRMELLSPLNDYILANKLTKNDVTQLGIDMCKALELCQKYNIIHRDIKPENIFVSINGDFKIGDFGIARTVEKTTSGLSKKGTYLYMAPEIYRGNAYGSSVDMYSLGLVLYRLLNDNRNPFMPEYPAPIHHSDREKAMAKRINGAQIPLPKNADGRLAEIVLKACAYDPKDRYSSPMQMREELESILYSRGEASIIYPQGDEAPIKPAEYIDESDPVTDEETPVTDEEIPVVKDTPVFEDVPVDETPAHEGTVNIFSDPLPSHLQENEKKAHDKPVDESEITPLSFVVDDDGNPEIENDLPDDNEKPDLESDIPDDEDLSYNPFQSNFGKWLSWIFVAFIAIVLIVAGIMIFSDNNSYEGITFTSSNPHNILFIGGESELLTLVGNISGRSRDTLDIKAPTVGVFSISQIAANTWEINASNPGSGFVSINSSYNGIIYTETWYSLTWYNMPDQVNYTTGEAMNIFDRLRYGRLLEDKFAGDHSQMYRTLAQLVSFNSSDNDVISISSEDGTITVNGIGSATITVWQGSRVIYFESWQSLR